MEFFRQWLHEGRQGEILNGHFLILAWNERGLEWHIWTDRFGTFHAYYANNGQQAAIGTFFPAVAAAASRRRLDWLGLTGLFAFGFFPQDRTFFDDVRILRPASHYVFDESGRLLQQERYWQWWHEPDRKRSYEDTVGEFAEIFHAVMADMVQEERIAIPISGGLDSRSTVAAITERGARSEERGARSKERGAGSKEQGARSEEQGARSMERGESSRFWAYSYGYSDDSVETRIARQVAAARGLPFESFTIGPYLFDQLGLVLNSVEGFQDVTQCRQAAIVRELANHADYVIAAHWGDVWLDDMRVGSGERGGRSTELVEFALHKMEKRGRAWLLENLCRSHLRGDEPEALLREMVREEMEPLRYIEDPDFRVKAFKTDQWSFRWTLASIRMFQPGALPRLPFYDTRLTDFFLTVPTEFLRGRRLQIDYLKRFAPDLARITWQPYDADLYHYQYFNTWLLPKRAVKKAWRILTRKRVIQRNWEVQFLNQRGQEGLNHWLLRPGLKLHEFVSPRLVKELLEEFWASPDAARGYTVSMLLTFSAWLELHAE